jgi:hypothetical protein
MCRLFQEEQVALLPIDYGMRIGQCDAKFVSFETENGSAT